MGGGIGRRATVESGDVLQVRPGDRLRVRVLPALLLTTALVAGGCSDDQSDSAGSANVSAEATTGTDTPAAGVESATAALAEGRRVIDVRTAREFDEQHVEGADNLDIQGGSFGDEFVERAAELPTDGAYVVYCRSGNRSAVATKQMRAAGLDVVDGGAIADMESAGWTITNG